MAILFTAASIAYAAVLILVAVRITNRRFKRPKRIAVFVLIPCLYALSFGPLASLGRHDLIPKWLMAPFGLFYEPLIWFLNGGGPASAFLNWLSMLWP
jgi:hypothetical protein